MIKQPPYLKKGDKVALVCPAKKLPKSIDTAIALLSRWGLEVIIGESVYASHHQFAGTDQLRAKDIQQFLDDPSIKAIIAGRGGYGSIRIIDELDFTQFNLNPKWFVGFSDITVLLSHIISQSEVQCIHGQMPYTFEESTPEALDSLKKALFGEQQIYQYESGFPNRSGEATGLLIGGNLTLLAMLQGSVSEMDFNDKILFLEDVGEHEYSIDRMMRMLKRAGKLKHLKSLIIGAFNEIEVEKIPFGQTANEVIWDIIQEYDYPVCFDFPTGHIDHNLTMVLGAEVFLKIETHNVQLKYL
ncbi:muramoyltetrapeptide carboxypeptidase [Pedobacter psychrotolerans]|uniref:Muramoyltetrapeptide carboxypeptidase n=1 Tax=Pedobacter psychrotolerans TaxID=1843235 RepID=A0A4R2HF13_9SPHI|nr:LD-carboxypeptidase [Pedobacter psychrotolerans]TCO27061.1 muramoyltetrapeptide carboxypeptidase [Pedobacter psychrotolerans]GGE58614.1 peptidase S66 [Pedobacter psychrotolerans]